MQLYIHVPFCARRCTYCDFAIAVRRETPSAAFTAAVLAEWRQVRARAPGAWSAPWSTVYLGGGTPSRLAPAALTELLAAFRSDPGILPNAEVTIEANPEDLTPSMVATWREVGINRVSLGAQSFDPRVLAWMHRGHGPDAVARAVALARAEGIENVSVDLIYGLPRELERDWDRDLGLALELEPSHVSLYGLTVEASTPLGRWVERGRTIPVADERAAAEYLDANRRLSAAGYHHYEVSNAARPGFESRHNSGYWNRTPYLGLGPSAHSASGDRRWWNEREWEGYRSAVAGGSAVVGDEILDGAQIRLEELYLGLRTSGGVAASSLPSGVAEEWVASGWARQVDSRVALTPLGWLRLDALVGRVVRL